MNYKVVAIVTFMFFTILLPVSSFAESCTNEELKSDFRCKNFWKYQFNLGYEFASINDIFEKGFARTGLQVYRGFVKEANDGFRFHGVDLFANFRLTSTAETEIDANASPNTSGGIDKALEVDIQLFFPAYISTAYILNDDKNKKEYVGPVISIGGRKVDSRNDIEGRYYAGLRAALDTDWFFDAMVGHTEGLNSARVELRAQMPIAKIKIGESSQLHLGGITNFGTTSNNGKGNDIVRVYISWGIDPEKIFTIFSPPQ